MTRERIEKAIRNRADERVRLAIEKFRNDVRLALKTFLKTEWVGDTGSLNEDARLMLSVLANNERKWPHRLWTREEERVREEVFATMDAVQRMLVAPDPPEGGDVPDEEKPEVKP